MVEEFLQSVADQEKYFQEFSTMADLGFDVMDPIEDDVEVVNDPEPEPQYSSDEVVEEFLQSITEHEKEPQEFSTMVDLGFDIVDPIEHDGEVVTEPEPQYLSDEVVEEQDFSTMVDQCFDDMNPLDHDVIVEDTEPLNEEMVPESITDRSEQFHQEPSLSNQVGKGKKRPLEHENENTPPTKKFRCATCEKEFTHSNNLTRHKKTHLEEKKFECSYCQKKFQFKFHKNRHERELHEKELKCGKCGMEFGNKVTLNAHVRGAHNKRKLQETVNNTTGKLLLQ